jgi:hypothetical protein
MLLRVHIKGQRQYHQKRRFALKLRVLILVVLVRDAHLKAVVKNRNRNIQEKRNRNIQGNQNRNI